MIHDTIRSPKQFIRPSRDGKTAYNPSIPPKSQRNYASSYAISKCIDLLSSNSFITITGHEELFITNNNWSVQLISNDPAVLLQVFLDGKENKSTDFLSCGLALASVVLPRLLPSSVVPLPFHEFAANNGDAARVTFSCHDARRRANAKQGIHGALTSSAGGSDAGASAGAEDRLSAVPD